MYVAKSNCRLWLSILKSNDQKSLPRMTARKGKYIFASMNGRYFFNSDDNDSDKRFIFALNS
jgi:hypothetical protein